jgi:tetratricopeptide (TPR) repeat protein
MRRILFIILCAVVTARCLRADAPASPAYATERQWIVGRICRNIFELLSYAKDKKGIVPQQVTVRDAGGQSPTFDVTVTGGGMTVESNVVLPGSIWSPAAYDSFSQAAARALHVTPPTGAPVAQGNPLKTLADYSDAALAAENDRVSRWLNDQPDNAVVQQQAAFILGVLAMKENSGLFWDPREMCNRACAHLAVARFLQPGPPTVEGQWAACLVGLIADTKAECRDELDSLAALKNPLNEETAWLNAGRMRNSRDWRIVHEPETATPVEQIEYYRAVAEAVDSDMAVNWAASNHLANRPDWSRIATEVGYSVEVGHEVVNDSIGLEIANMQAVFPARFKCAGIIGALNTPPGDVLAGDGHLAVIDDGMWAFYFQRHLCQAIVATGDFLQNKWGVPENAAQFDIAVQKAFSGLALYPNVEVFNFWERHKPVDAAAALALFQSHPEWDTYVLGDAAHDATELQQLRQGLEAWFQPKMLPGTAYDAFSRLPERGVSPQEADRLFALAPLQFRVAQLELVAATNAFTFDRAKEVLGPMLDYYTPAIDLARQALGLTFDQQVELAKKEAVINPASYEDLAELYQNAHQDDKAAEAYQQWFDKGTDRVSVSVNMEWLVNYYYDHGEKDHAEAIAQDGAEVYSFGGLQTMMHLLDREGRTAEAEEYGQKIKERYQDDTPLAGFYAQHAAKGEAAFQPKLDELAKGYFPDGLQPVTLASFGAAPTAGTQFVQDSPALSENGLHASQVVVALDGYAVANQKQYMFVRALKQTPEMHFIVWDDGHYREIVAHREGRRFGVNLSDYHG